MVLAFAKGICCFLCGFIGLDDSHVWPSGKQLLVICVECLACAGTAAAGCTDIANGNLMCSVAGLISWKAFTEMQESLLLNRYPASVTLYCRRSTLNGAYLTPAPDIIAWYNLAEKASLCA